MEKNAIKVKNLKKSYGDFTLYIPELEIPMGFATALIGENGAGKTTLLNCLTGIRLDYRGEIEYFGKYTSNDIEKNPEIKEKIGYTGTGNYYLGNWTVPQVNELSKILFKSYDEDKFLRYRNEFEILGKNIAGNYNGTFKAVKDLSDGNRTKLMLAGVLARDTDLLILDEPASPLDPLMRDRLCEILRDYLNSGEGKSVLFSTHNIADMENVTDYAVIVENGRVVEAGFVEDLKEKYIAVKGEAKDTEAARKILYTISSSNYGFEGICLAEDLDRLAGMDVVTETASLSKICIAIMKKHKVSL
jgi:ABC-2 type transport system ATP-binding protein